MLIQDNAVIGLVNQKSFKAKSEFSGNTSSIRKSDCCAVIIEPSGIWFSAVHRGGSTYRQMTSCCTSEYHELLKDAFLFRNGVLCNAVPFISRNLACIEPVEASSYASWPLFNCEDQHIPFKRISFEQVNSSSLLQDAIDFFNFGTEWVWNYDTFLLNHQDHIVLIDDGSVVIVGLHHTLKPILSLNPTGHLMKIIYASNVAKAMEECVEYNNNVKQESGATRISQIFSTKSVPTCFVHPLRYAQEVQRRFRIGQCQNKNNEHCTLDYVTSPYFSPSLSTNSDLWNQSYIQTKDNTEQCYEMCNDISMDVSELLRLSSCLSRSSDKEEEHFTSFIVMIEQRENFILRAVCSPGTNIVIEMLLKGDSSYFMLNESGDLLHHYFTVAGKDIGEDVIFDERVYHVSGLKYLEPFGKKSYSIESACVSMRKFLEQAKRRKVQPKTISNHVLSENEGREESHTNNAGIFTLFGNGKVHILFRNRAILDMEADYKFASLMLPNGISREVDIEHPPTDVKVYVRLVQEFIMWVQRSPKERQYAFEESKRKQVSSRAEYRKINRFLVTNIDLKFATTNNLLPDSNKCYDKNTTKTYL